MVLEKHELLGRQRQVHITHRGSLVHLEKLNIGGSIEIDVKDRHFDVFQKLSVLTHIFTFVQVLLSEILLLSTCLVSKRLKIIEFFVKFDSSFYLGLSFYRYFERF
jgi:hypothetical protein